MEHIVQFAIGIDDEAIRKSIAQTAEKQIIDKITVDLKQQIFQTDYYKKDKILGLSFEAKDMLKGFFDDHKDEIIAAAADHLFEYMKRTKAVKEAVAEAVQEASDGHN